MSHHTDDPICPLCSDKLLTAHDYLGSWFAGVKKRYPNVHVSWGFRDAQAQEQAFLDKKTNCHFPKSPHNNMKDGKPYSLALDLFMIDEDGQAKFPPLWYAKLNAENENTGEPLLWGGVWKKLGDSDHYQVDLTKLPK